MPAFVGPAGRYGASLLCDPQGAMVLAFVRPAGCYGASLRGTRRALWRQPLWDPQGDMVPAFVGPAGGYGASPRLPIQHVPAVCYKGCPHGLGLGLQFTDLIVGWPTC